MKVALLICAKPTDIHIGHAVYVPGGVWRIVTDCIDTEFKLLVSYPNAPDFLAFASDKLIKGSSVVKVEITRKGNEKIINIHLERIGD